jgi:hypothetical protein
MSTRTELEQVWLIRVNLAKQRYEETSRDYLGLVGNLKNGRTSTLGCSEVLRQARQRENLALDQYLRALGIYSDLVLKSMVPEERNSNDIQAAQASNADE